MADQRIPLLSVVGDQLQTSTSSKAPRPHQTDPQKHLPARNCRVKTIESDHRRRNTSSGTAMVAAQTRCKYSVRRQLTRLSRCSSSKQKTSSFTTEQHSIHVLFGCRCEIKKRWGWSVYQHRSEELLASLLPRMRGPKPKQQAMSSATSKADRAVLAAKFPCRSA